MALKVAIIGGSGLMGKWFQRFFEGQGLEVLVAEERARARDRVVADHVEGDHRPEL